MLLSFCLTACSDNVCKDITDSIIIKISLLLGLTISLGILFYSVKKPKFRQLELGQLGLYLCVVFALSIYLTFTLNCNMGFRF